MTSVTDIFPSTTRVAANGPDIGTTSDSTPGVPISTH